MTHKETETEERHSLKHTETAATGSEVNNDGEGSPSSNECPTSVQRKKPRRVTVSEITEELDTHGSPPRSSMTETHDRESTPMSSPEEKERVVYFMSQYLFVRLWRAIENYEIWDRRWVRAFLEGPQSFASKVNGVVRDLHRRVKGKPDDEVQPEDVARSYLEALRPRGLYDCCARILQKTKSACGIGVRPLKRKKPEKEQESEDAERFSMFANGEGSSKKFKHRFLMDPPRLIVLSGPEKTGFEEEEDMDVETEG